MSTTTPPPTTASTGRRHLRPSSVDDVRWITSGVPIAHPAPQELVSELLADRGLELFGDYSAGPWTHNRRGIGYVSTNAELIRLAHLLDAAAATVTHPVTLATQWIAAGRSFDDAGEWIRRDAHPSRVA